MTHPIDKSTANELRDTVGHYAEALRTLGKKPDAAIATIKSLLREARSKARPDAQAAAVIEREDQLLSDVVGWCTEAFNGLEAAD